MRGRNSIVSLCALTLLASGCSHGLDAHRGGTGDSYVSETTRATKSFPVGSQTRYVVDAHCGVQFAKIDGFNWKTRLRDDGQGNPPLGWPQRIEGVLHRVSKQRAVFASDQIPHPLVFQPAPDEQYTCL